MEVITTLHVAYLF